VYTPSEDIKAYEEKVQGLVDTLIKKHAQANPNSAPLPSETALKIAEEYLKAQSGLNPSEMYNTSFPVM
jgi:hypothetical protein